MFNKHHIFSSVVVVAPSTRLNLITLVVIYGNMSSVVCIKCKLGITKTRKSGITCNNCKLVIHASCANQDENYNLFASGTLIYFCEKCKNKHRKSIIDDKSDNSPATTPIQPSLPLASTSSSSSSLSQPLTSSENSNIVCDILQTLNEIKASQEFLSAKYDKTTVELKNMSDALIAISKENRFLKQQNSYLQKKLDATVADVAELKQEKLSDDVVICEIPKTIDESPLTLRRFVVDVIKNTAAAAAVDSVLDVYRSPYNANIHGNKNNTRSDAAADVIVKLKDSEAKNLLINNRRQLSSVFAKSLQKPETFQVYIKDHLTYHYKTLFNMARLLKHRADYKFVWTKHCKIYVKKDESNESLRTHIRSFHQLKALLQKNGINVTDPPKD